MMRSLLSGPRPSERKSGILLVALATLAVVAFVGVGCGGDDDEDGPGAVPEGEPIKVGQIFSIVGDIDYSAGPAGAAAYFERLNAEEGGINGRPVELLSEDDRGDPREASAAARRLVGEDIVAMVGGNSTTDCAANDEIYQQNDMTSIISLGSNPECFRSPNQVPINKGPVGATIQSASYLVDEVGAEDVVMITFDAPSGRAAAEPVEAFLNTRNALGGPTQFVSPGADPSAVLSRVARAEPDGVVILATFPVAVAIVQGLAQQGLTAAEGVHVGSVLTFYEQDAPEVAGDASEGITLPSDFLPLQADPEPQEMVQWREAMEEFEPDKRLGGEAQAGWIAADLFTEAVRTIDGEITPESVTEAFRSIENYENDMLACPISPAQFEGGIIHRCDHMIAIEDGEWTHLDEAGILEFPPEGFELPPPPDPEE